MLSAQSHLFSLYVLPGFMNFNVKIYFLLFIRVMKMPMFIIEL